MGSRPLLATKPDTFSPRLPGSKGAGKSQTLCQSGGPTGNLQSGTSHREAGAVENSFLQRWRQSQQWPLVSGGGNVNLNAWVGGGLSASRKPHPGESRAFSFGRRGPFRHHCRPQDQTRCCFGPGLKGGWGGVALGTGTWATSREQ